MKSMSTVIRRIAEPGVAETHLEQGEVYGLLADSLAFETCDKVVYVDSAHDDGGAEEGGRGETIYGYLLMRVQAR